MLLDHISLSFGFEKYIQTYFFSSFVIVYRMWVRVRVINCGRGRAVTTFSAEAVFCE